MDVYSKALKTGDYCELLALTRLVREGYDVAIPYGIQRGWDLLVEVDGKFEKWQVKTARRKKPHYKSVQGDVRRDMRIRSGRRIQTAYKEGDFDILLVVEADTGWMWKVPFKYTIGKSAIGLKDNSEYRWWNKEPSKFFLS